MVYFKSELNKHKSPSILKWAIYAVIFIAVLFLFIPFTLLNRAQKILSEEIPENTTADSCPKNIVLVAYNYLQVAKFFPLGEKKALAGQSKILDYYFPLFKEDYNKLKYACVDNAITQLRNNNPDIPQDTISKRAISKEWLKYPDQKALTEFRAKWDIYHKYYAPSLSAYPRIIDENNL